MQMSALPSEACRNVRSAGKIAFNSRFIERMIIRFTYRNFNHNIEVACLFEMVS